MPTPPRSSASMSVPHSLARHRNPTMAAYVGLGAPPKPESPERPTLLLLTPSGPAGVERRPQRKRRLQHGEKTSPTSKIPAKQKRVSRVPGSSATLPTPDSSCERSAPLFLDEPTRHLESVSRRYASHQTDGGQSSSTRTVSGQETLAAPSASRSSATVAFSDYENDSWYGHHVAPLGHDSLGNPSILNDDDLDDNLDDNDLLTLELPEVTISVDKPGSTHPPVVSSATTGVDSTDYCPRSTLNTPITLDDDPDQHKSVAKKFVSPVTLTTRLLAGSDNKTHAPIARSPFPSPVSDRSPIIGLTSNMLLRTCFRIGEVINQCSLASRSGQSITVELYARVLSSSRDDLYQHFTFCDLFHAKPPYIKARFSAAIWKQVPLFEHDSRRLLREGRMCRCIGTMKREEKEWRMTVLNVWEATWEDVEWSRRVVDS